MPALLLAFTDRLARLKSLPARVGYVAPPGAVLATGIVFAINVLSNNDYRLFHTEMAGVAVVAAVIAVFCSRLAGMTERSKA